MKLIFDIGGMSTKIAVFNSNNEIEARDVISYNGDFINNEVLLKLVKTNIELLTKQFKLEAICFASPAIINSETGEISGLSAIENYEKINFKKDLKEFNIPVYIENDANCAALAEIKFGSNKNIKNAIILAIGTGIGGAIIIDGKIFKGNFNGAGEFGAKIEEVNDNEILNVSRKGSTYSIISRYEKYTGRKIEAKEIFNLYDNDVLAKKAIDKMIFSLSKLIINLTFVLDPEFVMIGGAISKNNRFMKMLNEKVSSILKRYEVAKKFNIISCEFFNDANLYGALSLSL